MKISTLYLLLLLITAVQACERKSSVAIHEDLVLSISTVCGWCAGGDSLIIKSDETIYKHFASCDMSKMQTITNVTDKTVWNRLVSLLDKKKFNAVELNICNVCADGCDIRATVKDKNYNHSISYGSSENAEVLTIRPFLKELEVLRTQYKKDQSVSR